MCQGKNLEYIYCAVFGCMNSLIAHQEITFLRLPGFSERVFWALMCCACACCAGGLCAVLWARFLEQPAILVLQDLQDDESYGLPLGICPPPGLVTDIMFQQENKLALSTAVRKFIRKKKLKANQVELLDQWLQQHQTDLGEALFQSSPECETLMAYCRLQNIKIPCRELFYKEVTEWGVCCVMNQSILLDKSKQLREISQIKRLDLVLECSNASTLNGCELFAIYDGEDGSLPLRLQLGHVYRIKLVFTAVHHDGDFNQDTPCVDDVDYSNELCETKCVEATCGCLDPLRPRDAQNNHLLPVCTMAQISCLRNDHSSDDNSSCNCPSPCVNYDSHLTVENSVMNNNEYTFDSIYAGLDKKTSTVVHLQLRMGGSKMFTLHPTESWLTLLSSLGGVFNMFLGVGLFSALEFIFLLILKLLIATRTSTEMVQPPVYQSRY